jgi:hypothetical protein
MDDDHYLSQDETDSKNYQEQYFEDMIDDMKFSDEEDDEEEGWNKIKGTTTFKPPRQETNGKKKIDVNMNEYFDFFQNKYPPDIARYCKQWPKSGNY